MQTEGPPEWFHLEDYEIVRDFQLIDWYRALYIRDEYQSDLECRSKNEAAALKTEAGQNHFWETFFKAASPVRIQSLPKHLSAEEIWTYPFPSGRYTIEELSTAKLSDQHELQAILDWEMGAMDKRVLLVDVDAPDLTLVSGFKGWLIELRRAARRDGQETGEELRNARKKHPLPIVRRGKKAANVEVTYEHLKKWQNYKVLACFDLDFHAKVFNTKDLAHRVLCDLLKPTFAGDPLDWGREARGAVAEALSCVELLAYRIEGGVK